MARSQPQVLLARQPILDCDLRVVGYELLFRDGDDSRARVVFAERATAELLARALVDVGLDTLVGSGRAWINVARDFLVERRFTALPPERVMLEVLESVPATPEVIAALREARAQGFGIALDDFVEGVDNVALVDECDVIKLDCLEHTGAELARAVARLSRPGKRMLAEKVETREMFDACAAAGFHLFQGYFFARPALVRGQRTGADHVRLMKLLAELCAPDTSMERITELVQSDVTLSYRLMRYANSALVGRPVEFTSVRDVVNMLGLDRVRACATLLALGSASDKPAELATIALVRARYCELLGGLRGGNPGEHFVVGLFSVLDAYLDQPMASVVASLPLAKEITTALTAHAGRLGEVLDVAMACERADWDGESVRGFDPSDLASSYLEAVTWASRLQGALADA